MSLTGSICIEGQGPIALALQRLLAREGVASEQIAAGPLPGELPVWLASRPIALSLGSLHTLGRIAPCLSPDALIQNTGLAAPIRVVDISRKNTIGAAQIRSDELEAPLLGVVIRYGRLLGALREELSKCEPVGMAGSARGPALTIIADGDTAAAATRRRDFGQVALLAEIEASRDQPGIAYERFTADGPLALLPLPEPQRRALVWCAPEALAQRRLAASSDEFCAELNLAFGPVLGKLQLVGSRHISPVVRRIGPLRRGPHTLAIGNAAQALHPVAGQGLNLGLRDCAELARHIGDVAAGQIDIDRAIARFVQRRNADREVTVAVTDLLASLTCPELLRPAHAAGLIGLDLCAPLRKRVAQGFMHGLR
jgi:2-octaprenyl-6-methoxyphenol hydroxylase